MVNLSLDTIRTVNHPDWKALVEIYKEAFPPLERRTDESLQFCLENCPEMHINGIYNNHQFIGFVIFWEFKGFFYLEHFAVRSTSRNLGVGHWVLDQLKAKNLGKMVLECEPPEDEIAKRRIGFYERNGMQVISVEYFQESYTAQGQGLHLWLMASDAVTPEELNYIQETIKQQIYIRFYD